MSISTDAGKLVPTHWQIVPVIKGVPVGLGYIGDYTRLHRDYNKPIWVCFQK